MREELKNDSKEGPFLAAVITELSISMTAVIPHVSKVSTNSSRPFMEINETNYLRLPLV